MEIKLKLSREDYINYYLWSAFTLGEFDQKKKKSTRQFLIAFCVLAFAFFFMGSYILASIYVAVGVLLFFLYPIRLRKLYHRHYTRFVDTKLKDSIGEEVVVAFQDDALHTHDISGETKMNWSAIKQAYELEDYLYLIISSNQGLILPKKEISDLEGLKSILSKQGVAIEAASLGLGKK